MAATRLIPLHKNKGRSVARSLQGRTDYAANPEKTENSTLITAYGCDPKTVDEEFLLQKRQYHHIIGKSPMHEIIAYQIRQSFKPGEISPEEANRLGQETALRFTKGQYSFLVATHTDRAHIHNHIIFNSVSMDGTKKFRNIWLSSFALQKVSDLVCLENGVSVIQPKPYRERQKRTIYPKKERPQDERSVDLLLDIQEKMKGKGPGYKRWATVYNLKQMAKTLLFLRDHNIDNLEQLHAQVAEKTAKRDELLTSLRLSEEKLNEIAILKTHIINYSKTRNVYEDYRKAGYSKKFLEAHWEAISLHKAAKQAFDELEMKKIPKLKELSEHYAVILSKKRATYSDYRKVRQEAQELLVAEQNIKALYDAGKKDEQEKQKTEKQHG